MEKSNHASVNISTAMHEWSSTSSPVQWFNLLSLKWHAHLNKIKMASDLKMFPALCTIMVIEMFEFSKQCGNPHRKLQTIIFNWFRLNRDNYWRGEVEIVRESDEDVESEIERSIFNIVMPTRVGRERLFTCPVEWEIFLSRWTDVPVFRRCQSVQLFIYYVHAISFR